MFEPALVDVALAGRPEDVANVGQQWRDALDSHLDRDGSSKAAPSTIGGAELLAVDPFGVGFSMRRSIPKMPSSPTPRSGTATNATIERTTRDLPTGNAPTRSPTSSATTSTANPAARTGRTCSSSPTRPRSRVKQSGCCETISGYRLHPETLRRLACDSIVQRIVLDSAEGSRSIWVARSGRSRRISTGRSCSATADVGCRAAMPAPKTAKRIMRSSTGKTAARPTSPTVSQSAEAPGTID